MKKESARNGNMPDFVKAKNIWNGIWLFDEIDNGSERIAEASEQEISEIGL